MLATVRLGTRRSASLLYHTQRTKYAPITLRWASGGVKDKAEGGKVEEGEKSKDSDKVVKEYLDSLKSSEAVSPSAGPLHQSGASQTVDSAKTTPSPTPDSSPTEKSPPPFIEQFSSDANRARASLAIWKDTALSLVRSRAQKASAGAAVQFHELGGKLNKVTGYDEIEALKRRVVERGACIKLCAKQIILICMYRKSYSVSPRRSKGR
jgi:hypothetical protein